MHMQSRLLLLALFLLVSIHRNTICTSVTYSGDIEKAALHASKLHVLLQLDYVSYSDYLYRKDEPRFELVRSDMAKILDGCMTSEITQSDSNSMKEIVLKQMNFFDRPHSTISIRNDFMSHINFEGCFEIPNATTSNGATIVDPTNNNLIDQTVMTPSLCNKRCLQVVDVSNDKSYFYLFNTFDENTGFKATKCYCVTSITTAAKLDMECDNPCSGDSSAQCGSDQFHSGAFYALTENQDNTHRRRMKSLSAESYARILESVEDQSSTMSFDVEKVNEKFDCGYSTYVCPMIMPVVCYIVHQFKYTLLFWF